MPDTPHPNTSPVSAGFRLVLAGVLSLALVASVVLWGYIALRGNDAEERQEQRDAVMLAARAWADASLNYGKKDLDANGKLTAYRKRVEPLITTSAKKAFETEATGLEPLVATQNNSKTTTIERVGVEVLDEDSAEVVVGFVFTETLAEASLGPAPFQLLVELERIDGDWLVAGSEPIVGEAP